MTGNLRDTTKTPAAPIRRCSNRARPCCATQLHYRDLQGYNGGSSQARAGSIYSECSPLDSGLQAVQVEVVQVEVVQAEVVQVEVVQAGLRGGLG